MLLRYFYDEKLAHASYLVGCQKTGEAAIIDPMRNIAPYLEVAKKENMTITAALETHIHADFVTGSRELEAATGATMIVSDEGDENWKYQNLEGKQHRLVKDGDHVMIGNIKLDVWHTPGHTPESLSFVLTDQGGGADAPMGIFTGDFVFVGDIGRPDLLEKAAGVAGTSAEGAHAMFQSLKRFKELADYVQVWPGHGAGSACGKSLGAVPSSTVGYEKTFNWALRMEDEQSFTDVLLDGQPEPPAYFAVMKRVNKVGVPLVSELPTVQHLSASDLMAKVENKEQVVDTRAAAAFAKGHIEGTINIPFNNSFPNWAGWLVNYDQPVTVIVENEETLQSLLIAARSVGIDTIEGFVTAEAVEQASSLETYESVTPAEVEARVTAGEVHVLDVRNQSEWNAGHINGAQHIMLGTLPKRLAEVPTDKPIVVQCGSGVRSAIGLSVLQAAGVKDVVNLTGGWNRWVKETDAATVTN